MPILEAGQHRPVAPHGGRIVLAIGVWVGPDWTLSSLVPWEPRLLEFLTLNAKTTHLLVVLQKKLHDTEFCIPIQGVYEDMLPDNAVSISSRSSAGLRPTAS